MSTKKKPATATKAAPEKKTESPKKPEPAKAPSKPVLSDKDQKALDSLKRTIAEGIEKLDKAGRPKLAKHFAQFGALTIRQFSKPSKGNNVGERVPCAIVGCADIAECKGYCRKDYQHRRRVKIATGKAPVGWIENAKPQSIKRAA